MCGIAGLIDPKGSLGRDGLSVVVERMASRLQHRGPDDAGVWIDDAKGIALGHRRLAIIDLSKQGRQPMFSADRRYVLVFNGEIYNFVPLRRRLEAEGYRFRSRSDTEVLLAAIVEWGLEGALELVNGMFAFALWDSREGRLFLARDRIGEKPLYHGKVGGMFVFGSELKALRAVPGFAPRVDRRALALYMRLGYIPAPHCIYEGIEKVPPGTLVVVNGETGEVCERRAYWSLRDVALKARDRSFRGEFAEAVARLDGLLRDAIALRAHADVPVGAFLSGGVDSSTVVGVLQSMSAQPVQTFTVGFAESGYNEAEYAKAVAQHLGTEHHEIYVTAREAQSIIPELPRIYDEPFADPAQIPNYLIAKLARQSVVVCLSGDGGDELFCGYTRYQKAERFWRLARWVPQRMRRVVGEVLDAAAERERSVLGEWAGGRLGRHMRRGNLPYRLRTLGGALKARSASELYWWMVSHWREADEIVVGIDGFMPALGSDPFGSESNICEVMSYHDMSTYLPEDLMVKLDRATMAVSLEARVPLLDYRIVEFAFSLPARFKKGSGRSKRALREVLYRYVPRRIVDREKHGFSVPVGEWLRGGLRQWAEGLLDETRLRQGGYLDVEVVRRCWHEHQSGESDWQYLLWDVLMFEAWREEEGV